MSSIFDGLDSFLSKNPALTQLANSAISGAVQKSAPKVKEVAPAVQTISVPSPGMSSGMMIGIGVALIGTLVAVVMIFRGRK